MKQIKEFEELVRSGEMKKRIQLHKKSIQLEEEETKSRDHSPDAKAITE